MDNIKSFETYMSALISRLEFGSFEPKKDDNNTTALRSLLDAETVFWEKFNFSPSWNKNWIGITPKDPINGNGVSIAFFVSHLKIKAVVFDFIDGSQFDGKKHEEEISLAEIWLDHKKLCEWLTSIIGRSIKYNLNSASPFPEDFRA
nr:hypothetical protein [uncultured Bdellovibrio sp.]